MKDLGTSGGLRSKNWGLATIKTFPFLPSANPGLCLPVSLKLFLSIVDKFFPCCKNWELLDGFGIILLETFSKEELLALVP